MNRVLWLFLLLILSNISYADYLSEQELMYYNLSADLPGGSSGDADNTSLGAIVYFSPVVTENVPIAEAGFLSKKSAIGLYLVESDSKYNNPPGYTSQSSSDGRFLYGHFLIPGPDLIVGASIGQFDTQFDTKRNNDFSTAKITSDDLDVILGWYITDASMLRLAYGRGEEKTETEYLSFFALPSVYKYKEDLESLDVGYKHIISLNNGHYIGVEGSLDYLETSDESSNSYTRIMPIVAVDWYLNERFSLGLEVRYFSYDSDDTGYDYLSDDQSRDYDLNARYYFNERIGLSASYSDGRGWDNDGTMYNDSGYSLVLYINM